MSRTILIAKNVRLTYRLTATAIYISATGEICIHIESFGPNVKIPQLSVEYLDSLCSSFYYGGYTHKTAIADIMLLNGYLSSVDYESFYDSLRRNLEAQRMTIISTEQCP